jgi:hypothetical protein
MDNNDKSTAPIPIIAFVFIATCLLAGMLIGQLKTSDGSNFSEKELKHQRESGKTHYEMPSFVPTIKAGF